VEEAVAVVQDQEDLEAVALAMDQMEQQILEAVVEELVKTQELYMELADLAL
jgi:hypothetical protein